MKTRIISQILIMVVVLIASISLLQAAKYKVQWNSLAQHPDPQWFSDAKFDIYFHWEPYSVSAYKTEWYSHYLQVPGHACNEYHLKTYGPLDKFNFSKRNKSVWACLMYNHHHKNMNARQTR